jgi:iron complex outermembrane receptor protein
MAQILEINSFNVGSVRTKGVEFSIESDIVKKNLNWNVAFNTTFIDQKIAGLGITVPSFQGYTGGIAGGRNNIQINSVGYAPNSFCV